MVLHTVCWLLLLNNLKGIDDMKTYKLKLNAAQPVRQTLPVPTNTYKYGVSVVTENIDTSNLSCSMTDGTSTIYGVKQPDNSFLITLSSNAEENNRLVKFTLAAGAKNIGGIVNDVQAGSLATVDLFTLPAGKYTTKDLAPIGKAFMTGTSGPLKQYKPKNNDGTNLVGFYQINVRQQDGAVSLATSDNKLVPEDEVVEVLADTTFKLLTMVTESPYISPDIFMGESIASYHEVVLNETMFAVADGDIEDVPPTDIIVDSINAGGTTHDVEWKTITIDGVDCIVLAAKTTEE